MSSVLLDKPYFTLRIESRSCKYNVYLNGIAVLEHRGGSPLTMEMPLNHWMHTKNNDLQLEYFTDKDWPLSPKMDCHITLQVRPNEGDENSHLKLGSIHLQGQNIDLKDNPLIVTPPGRYNSSRQLYKEDGGDVVIKAAIIKDEQVDKDDPHYFSHAITLPMDIPNSLPLWAFYGSDEIPDIDFIPKDQYPQYKNSFVKIYQNILQGITTGNIDALLPLFAERNQENDRAFYFEAGHTAKRLKQVFQNVHEKLKKNEAKPLTVDAKYLAFDYQGKNLVRFLRNDDTPAIAVNYPKLHMSESFDIIFRRKNDKWIISR